MTLAEQWRQIRPQKEVTATGYALMIRAIDHSAVALKTDLGIVIKFSDGSLHRMGNNDKIRSN